MITLPFFLLFILYITLYFLSSVISINLSFVLFSFFWSLFILVCIHFFYFMPFLFFSLCLSFFLLFCYFIYFHFSIMYLFLIFLHIILFLLFWSFSLYFVCSFIIPFFHSIFLSFILRGKQTECNREVNCCSLRVIRGLLPVQLESLAKAEILV